MTSRPWRVRNGKNTTRRGDINRNMIMIVCYTSTARTALWVWSTSRNAVSHRRGSLTNNSVVAQIDVRPRLRLYSKIDFHEKLAMIVKFLLKAFYHFCSLLKLYFRMLFFCEFIFVFFMAMYFCNVQILYKYILQLYLKNKSYKLTVIKP